jgi:hypothetical protein
MKGINWSSLLADTWKAFGSWALISAAYQIGKYGARSYRGEKGLKFADSVFGKVFCVICALGILLFLSYFLAVGLGTHTEDADPLYGGGETVVDYEVSDKERFEYGISIFLELTIPSLIGLYAGYASTPLYYIKSLKRSVEQSKDDFE